jgi:hypothetical protein
VSHKREKVSYNKWIVYGSRPLDCQIEKKKGGKELADHDPFSNRIPIMDDDDSIGTPKCKGERRDWKAFG